MLHEKKSSQYKISKIHACHLEKSEEKVNKKPKKGKILSLQKNQKFENTFPGRLVGTVAVVRKSDPDMRERPGSVAWLRRMAVDSAFRRRGLGARWGKLFFNDMGSH